MITATETITKILSAAVNDNYSAAEKALNEYAAAQRGYSLASNEQLPFRGGIREEVILIDVAQMGTI